MKHSPGFLKIVNEAKKQIKELNVDQVASKLKQKHSFYLVDVREESEWNAGHIQGAIHLGKGVIERDVESKIPEKNSEIILYCGGGFRSALAADALQKMGYTHVYSMDGGWRAWKEKNLPTSPG